MPNLDQKLTFNQMINLLSNMFPGISEHDLKTLANETYKAYEAPEVTIEHKGKFFTVSQYTKEKTIIEGVEFSPIATDVFDSVSGYLKTANLHDFWVKGGLDKNKLTSEFELMFDWLMCQNPDYIRVLQKKDKSK